MMLIKTEVALRCYSVVANSIIADRQVHFRARAPRPRTGVYGGVVQGERCVSSASTPWQNVALRSAPNLMCSFIVKPQKKVSHRIESDRLGQHEIETISMIRVALMDDHPLVLRIVRQELARESDLEVIWDTSDANQMVTMINKDTPEVLILDLAFSGQAFEPVGAVRDLRARVPQMAILILTAYDDPVWIEELLQAGVQGYVVKSDDLSLRLAHAVRTVAQQRTFLSPTAVSQLTQSRMRHTLTPQERSILRLAAQGQANPAIAQTLGIANGTVRNHLSNIYWPYPS
jgi:DNA-binding NarL/FixJ family response regulator